MNPIHNAVRESQKRLASMTPEQRESLSEEARKRIYPNGYWKCDHDMRFATIPKGKPCPMCGKKES